MFKLDLEKVEESESNMPTSVGHRKRKRFPENIYFCFIGYTKAFDYVDHGKLSTKKDVQLESCELSFICGKMGTAAQEAASQIGLRDFSKAAMEESQYIRFW